MRATISLSLLLGMCILLNGPPPSAAETSKGEPNAAQGNELPAHLARGVAPAADRPWSAPDLSGYTIVLKSVEQSPVDPQKHYQLVELIDLAQRTNPETRVAWEKARQAAIGVGLVESSYYPSLVLAVLGGYQNGAIPKSRDLQKNMYVRADFMKIFSPHPATISHILVVRRRSSPLFHARIYFVSQGGQC